MLKRIVALTAALLMLLVNNNVLADGTKNIVPNSTNPTALALLPSTNSGSFLNCSQDNRIYFNIKDHTTENFYYGFRWTNYGNNTLLNNVYIKIFNPSGTLVLGPTLLPSAAAAGFITTYAQAFAGPNIAGTVPTGYTPLVFDPTANGDYWIEVYQSSDAGATQLGGAASTTWSKSDFFDLTVATAAGALRNGRIHCDKWGFVAYNPGTSVPSYDAESEASFYTYTSDSTISRISFEPGFRPIAFNFATNSYGVANSSNFSVDRRSVNAATAPTLSGGYKVFLSEPDTSIYKIGAFPLAPTFASPIAIGCFPGPFTLRYYAPQNGDYFFLFDLNGTAGYQAGTRDRVIELFNQTAGNNTFTWNGLDGLGNPVTSGTNFNLTFINKKGRINIPLYDAELNINGIRVASILPQPASNIRIFWDDASLTNVGTTCAAAGDNANNVTGTGLNNSILGTLTPSHAWSGNGNTTQIIPAPAVGTNETTNLQCDDFGNVRVMNSWTYSTEISSQIVINLVCLSLSGTVWNDVNSSAAGTFSNIFTAGENGTNAGGLFVNLIDPATGLVLASVPVGANGTYTISNVPANGANMPLRLSTTIGTVGSLPPAAGIPVGWSLTSPNQNAITTVSTNLSGLDFGIKQNLPLAEANFAQGAEDSTITIAVLTNDTFGVDGPSTGTITITDNANHGTATVNNGGTPNNPADDQIIYTPNPNYNGNDTLIYQICDATGDCDTAIVYINVAPRNDLPLANADEATVPEDGSVTVAVLTNDTFGGDGPSTGTITITTPPTHGTASVNDGGTPNDPTDDQIIYTPTSDYNGPDALIYEICDSNGDCDTAIVHITVTPVNDLPLAEADEATVPEDGSVTVAVLTNDTFGGDGPSTGTITITTPPTHGTASVNDGGTPNDPTDDQIVYTPTSDYNGPDALIYEICDSNGDCDTAIVTITVTPVNDPPVIEDTTVTTPEDTPITVCVPFTDVDLGDTHTSTTVCGPTNGSISAGPTVTGNTICLTYTPNTNYHGSDSICVVVCDSSGACDTGVIHINIIFTTDTIEHVLPIKTTLSICNILRPIDDTITVTACDGSTSGTAGHGLWSIDTAGCLVYTAGPLKGNDTLCVKACNNEILQQCIETIIIVQVTGLPPIAVNDSTHTDPGVPVTIPVLVNDTTRDEDPLTLCAIVTQPGHGGAVLNTDGTVTYTPAPGYTGVDSFEYRICDPEGDTTAWVYIRVEGCIIPNAFSPNGDGINDVFEIPCAEGRVNFRVYNRWGIEVYYSEDYLSNWDGQYKTGPLPDGTYYYVLMYKKSNGEEVNKAGFITLHR